MKVIQCWQSRSERTEGSGQSKVEWRYMRTGVISNSGFGEIERNVRGKGGDVGRGEGG